MAYKSELELRIEALESKVGDSRMLQRMAAVETKAQTAVNSVSGLNLRVTELENAATAPAGTGPAETKREADPALNAVTLPVDRAALDNPEAYQPVTGSQGEAAK